MINKKSIKKLTAILKKFKT